jgi:hypothetical protein
MNMAMLIQVEVNGFVRNVLAEDLEIVAVIELVHFPPKTLAISDYPREKNFVCPISPPDGCQMNRLPAQEDFCHRGAEAQSPCGWPAVEQATRRLCVSVANSTSLKN